MVYPSSRRHSGGQLTTSNLPITVPVSKAAPGRLLRRLAGYAVSRGATEAMLGVRGVLLATLLGPAAFGSWALLRMVMRYSALSGFSVYRGLELELLQAGAESPSHRRAPAAALGFVLVVSGSIAGLALTASFLVHEGADRLLLRGFAAASLAEALYGYALVCTRVKGNLRRYSLLESGTSLLHVVCAVGLASVWGLGGALVGLTIANLLGVAAATRWVELRPSLDVEPVRRMLRVGFPMVLTMGTGILLATGDRWVVALWGGSTMLGYYAFAGSLTTAAAALALVVRTVVFPQVYGEASSAGAAAALQSHLERALLPFAWLLPPLLGAASLALGPIVAGAIPTYLEAVAPARLFLLSGAAMGLVNLASIGAVAAGQQRRLPLYAASGLALTCALSVAALASGYGLGAVAGATFAGHLLFAALVLRLNVQEAGVPRVERFVAAILLPLVWCTGAVSITGALFPATDSLSAVLALGIYLLLLLPLASRWKEEWRRLQR